MTKYAFSLTSINRRDLLGVSIPLFAWAHAPRALSASGQTTEDSRLLLVLLRGGLDGLSAVPPVGDPAFSQLRAITAFTEMELQNNIIPLNSEFALNANLSRFGQLFHQRQAIVVHAVATSSRNRSHFEAQDVLESGLPSAVSNAASGWLNRALQTISAGSRVGSEKDIRALAIAPTMPLIMRGSAPVGTWQPQSFEGADPDTIARAISLYRQNDQLLADALERGVVTDQILSRRLRPKATTRAGPELAEAVNAVVSLMARADGPRIATMNVDGWDTHINQGFSRGRFGTQMQVLDSIVGALADGLSPIWANTVVVLVTEFGRTARLNGSGGTDHGTGTVALLIGGAVNGGRVIADWPGLAQNQLFEGRDLTPTTDLRSVFKGVLHEHLGISETKLNSFIFPQSTAARPLTNLIR